MVLTNGLLVTRESVLPLRDAVDCLGIAFDGCGPDDVAYLRGSQRFGRLVDAVRTSLDAGIAVRIMPTLHAGNLGDLDRYAELARSLGASLGFSLLTAPLSELGDLALGEKDLAALGRRAACGGVGIVDPLATGGIAARRACGAGVRRTAWPQTEPSTPATCCTTRASRWAMPSRTTPTPYARARWRRCSRSSTRVTSSGASPAPSATSAPVAAARERSRHEKRHGVRPLLRALALVLRARGRAAGKTLRSRGGERDAVRT